MVRGVQREMTETCESCRFWRRILKGEVLSCGEFNDHFGECKRHPPVIWDCNGRGSIGGQYWSSWPECAENEWCGEFAERHKERAVGLVGEPS